MLLHTISTYRTITDAITNCVITDAITNCVITDAITNCVITDTSPALLTAR